MLSYPATIPLSSRTLNHLAERIRGHRKQRRSRWRRLDPGRQALLALAHLRNGDTYTRLAAGFQIGVATAWRYVQEAIALLSAAADELDTAMARIRLLAYAILDGTLIPIDRVADQKPYYSGKHKRHGVNAGHRRRRRPPRLGVTRPAGLSARPDRRPCPRHHRRPDQRRRDDFRR
jgi:hypothetical protein